MGVYPVALIAMLAAFAVESAVEIRAESVGPIQTNEGARLWVCVLQTSEGARLERSGAVPKVSKNPRASAPESRALDFGNNY
jgi:hypothetical protein